MIVWLSGTLQLQYVSCHYPKLIIEHFLNLILCLRKYHLLEKLVFVDENRCVNLATEVSPPVNLHLDLCFAGSLPWQGTSHEIEHHKYQRL
jgi:hypothetical protein